MNPISLDEQEKKWLLERCITRLTDNQEVLIYPMGAERYLSRVLSGDISGRYDIKAHISGKRVLIIPGYGNSCFLFAEAGAKAITVYDKDPVTIAWVKAFKRFYHYREQDSYPSVGELLGLLTCWYPPRGVTLPSGTFKNAFNGLINPNALRRAWIFYLLSLVQLAIKANVGHDFELAGDIQFFTGDGRELLEKQVTFDTAFVPYLLGVKNGIEHEKDIVAFIKRLLALVPKGLVIVNPTQNNRQFRWIGPRYFVTCGYQQLQDIPQLQDLLKASDSRWFNTQGLAVFSR